MVWPAPSERLAEAAATFVVKLRLPEPLTAKTAAEGVPLLSEAQLPVMFCAPAELIATVQAALSAVKSPKDRSEVLLTPIGATTLAVTLAVAVDVVLLLLPPGAAWLSPAANHTAVNKNAETV